MTSSVAGLIVTVLLAGMGCRLDSGHTAVVREVSIAIGEQVTCGDAAQRESAGPLFVGEFGPDWAAQIAESRWPASDGVRQGFGVVVDDLDGDGLLDVALPNFGPDQLYFGAADGTLTDLTSERWPAPEDDPTEALVAVDVDGDFDLDLFACNRGARNRLYLNDGEGNFSDAGDVGLTEEPWGSVGAAFGDLDLDGDLDLLVLNHALHEFADAHGGIPAADPNQLYLNNGDGTFENVTVLLPAVTNDAYTYMGGFYQLTDDLYPDIYLTNDYGPFYRPNMLLKNRLGKFEAFKDVSAGSGLDVAIGGMGLAIGEINGDGVIDFMLTNWGPIILLESAEDSWLQTREVREVTWNHDKGYYASWGVDLQDLDNDTDLDSVAACGQLIEPNNASGNPEDQPDALFLREGEVFVEVGEEWGMHQDVGNSRGMVNADLNGDGYLDVVKRDIRGDAKIWLSRCGEAGWASVDLRFDGANTRGVGARIDVDLGGSTLSRWVGSTGRGFATSHPHTVHFGLGDAQRIDKMVVTWPDGVETSHGDLPVNRHLTISRTDR